MTELLAKGGHFICSSPVIFLKTESADVTGLQICLGLNTQMLSVFNCSVI